MIGAWWDECKHIRELYPKGDRRKAAFEVGARRLEIRLADIGLPMPRNLPSGKAKAVPEAYRRFLAVAGTEVL